MPTGTVTKEIAASSAEVFAILHDYSRRLEWDTLLSAAYLESPGTQAELGTTSVCVGKRHLGSFALHTRNVTFCPLQLAAVELLNQPPFFTSFAASIRSVEERTVDGLYSIVFVLTAGASQRYAEFTHQNVGLRVELFCHGWPLETFPITESFSSSEIVLRSNLVPWLKTMVLACAAPHP